MYMLLERKLSMRVVSNSQIRDILSFNNLDMKNSKAQSFADWEVGQRYQIIRQVGAGSYGSVVEALDTTTNQKVAIKRITGIFDDIVDCKRILREICLLRIMRHENVISIIEIIKPVDLERFNSLLVVTDYC